MSQARPARRHREVPSGRFHQPAKRVGYATRAHHTKLLLPAVAAEKRVAEGWVRRRSENNLSGQILTRGFPAPLCPLCSASRRGFTLVEMLVTIAIIAMLAGLAMASLYAAQQSARAARTRATIAKLHQALAPRWESYRTRRLPMDLSASYGNARQLALFQLLARRQLMRMELPDRWADINFDVFGSLEAAPYPERAFWVGMGGLLPAGKTERHLAKIPGNIPGTDIVIPRPALSQAYLRRYGQISPPPTPTYQGAECLYMILTTGLGDDSGADVVFSRQDIGDFDNDGAPEFLDGWGRPIDFLRWAPGFYSDLQPGNPAASNPITGHDPQEFHDPFDPLRVDPIAFELFPLIYSGGPDGDLAIEAHVGAGFGSKNDFNDPYAPSVPEEPSELEKWRGSPTTGTFGGGPDDNIHNHLLDLRR